MLKKVAVIVVGTLFIVGCGQSTPSSPSILKDTSFSSSSASNLTSSSVKPAPLAQGPPQAAFGFNGTVSGFPHGTVFVTGGGAYNLAAGFVKAAGGFKCVDSVLQGPLSTSINPNDPGPCLKDEGVRWDTAMVLTDTGFKCTAADSNHTATTSDHVVVLQADFYRAGDGNDESFTAKMVVSDGDLDGLPGVNLWVQGVGCGTAQTVNFSK